mmetsp:Transcript_3136/g.10352  ORF Transcript_3136/g.10352 Transcript_3136/m.10352 type:complete len:231 (+) Transcript_3136:698-1390(+)
MHTQSRHARRPRPRQAPCPSSPTTTPRASASPVGPWTTRGRRRPGTTYTRAPTSRSPSRTSRRGRAPSSRCPQSWGRKGPRRGSHACTGARCACEGRGSPQGPRRCSLPPRWYGAADCAARGPRADDNALRVWACCDPRLRTVRSLVHMASAACACLAWPLPRALTGLERAGGQQWEPARASVAQCGRPVHTLVHLPLSRAQRVSCLRWPRAGGGGPAQSLVRCAMSLSR